MTERDRDTSNKRNYIIPIIQTDRFEKDGIYSPFTFEPVNKEEGEIFEIVTDNSSPNVVPGRYMVSNHGRVWDSYDKRFMPTAYNKAYNENGTNDGYLKTKLVCYDSFYGIYSRDRYIHRVVLSEFDPNNDDNKIEVNHKNGDKTNNNLENLEWITHEGNIQHAIDNGLLEDFAFLPSIPDETVIKICEELEKGVPVSIIADKFNVARHTVQNIKIYGNYKRISKNYNFAKTDFKTYGLKYKNFTDTNILHDICRRLEKGESAIKIADSYNIPKQTVYRILNGVHNKHISSQYDFSNYDNRQITSDDKVHEICRLLQEGKTTKEVSDKTGVTRTVIQKIRNRKQYTEISSQYSFPEARPMQNKLSEEEIRKVCELLQSGESLTNASIRTGVKYQIVQNIQRHISYTSISKDYTW